MFDRLGFTVIYPEDLDFGTQVSLFQQAEVVAGFGGSGLFNTMFAPNRTVLILTGDSYTPNNEYLIKSVIGGDLHYFWADSQIKHPPRGWTWAAFQSNFVFDVPRFEDQIARVSDQASAAR